MKKRLPALLLAILTAQGASLTSCLNEEPQGSIEVKKDKTNKNKGNTQNTSSPSGEVTEEGEPVPEFVVPEGVSGDGEDFDVFIAYSVANSDFVTPESETGETINDILYKRNKEVDSTYDVNFKFRKGAANNSESTPTIRSLIQSGDDTYEVFINVQHVGIPLIYEDLFVEWTENMPYVNLDNPWWYQNVQRDLNFNGKVYVAAGAYNFHCLRGAGVLAFNKTMLDELGLDYPYQLVLDGEWTADRMIEYMKAAQKDLNGDGLMKPEDDRYGVAGWKYEMMPAFFVGMGGNPVTKDDNDMPELNINNERTFDIMDKMLEVFEKGNGGFSNGETYAKTGNMFKEGRLLFHDTNLDQLAGLRDMEDNFGAIPYPKLDEDQESYYSRVVNYSSLTYIPVTNNKLELTSAILEHMAYLSDRDLIPAFYDVILTIKTSRDVETEAMVDIVRETARFMDENFVGSGTIINIVESGNNTLASRCASQEDAWEIKLNDYIEFWEK